MVIAALPLLGDVHLDGDINGRGVLAWTGLQGSSFVAQATDVEAGRRIGRVRDLWRAHAGVAVEDVDVAGSGAAAVCLRERPSRGSEAWRVRVVLRSARGAWSRPVLVAAPGQWVERVDCAVDDAGNVALAWQEGIPGRLRAAAVHADGSRTQAVTLGHEPEPPDVEMGTDGTAVVAFATGDPDTRRLHVAEHSPTAGWSGVVQVPPTDEPVQGPELAVDGTGRRLLGWNGGNEDSMAVRLATGTGTTLAPATLIKGFVSLSSLVASTRGDVLVTYNANEVRADGSSSLHAVLERPGAAFGSPLTLGHLAAFPLQTALAADGSGLAAWISGSDRRPQTVVRALSPEGRWGRTRQLSRPGQVPGLDLGIAPGPPGRSTVAWTVGRFGSGVVRLRVAAI